MSIHRDEEARHLREIANEIIHLVDRCTGSGPASLLEQDLLKERIRSLYSLADKHFRSSQSPEASYSQEKNSISAEIRDLLRSGSLAPEADAKAPEPAQEVLSVKKESVETIPTPQGDATATENRKSPENPPPSIRMEQIPAATSPADMRPSGTRSTSTLFEEPETLAGQYNPGERVSDKLSKDQNAPRLSDTLASKSAPDLLQAIGLNERFAFINELFNGNAQSFQESLEYINRAQTYEEACHILHEQLAIRFSWKANSKRVAELKELVRRKFHA